MTNSILWVGYPRSYTAGRTRPPQFVVMHYTAGPEGPSSAENGAHYDKIRTDGTSCHYFVDSSGPALQEVPDGDRCHSAYYHGNEIGLHIELCGYGQTREQWLDEASTATLKTAAWLVATLCARHGFPIRRLTTAEVRAAYYNKPENRPSGITDHGGVTAAFPEDHGDHTDVGPGFPWDVFMQWVAEAAGQSIVGGNLMTTAALIKDKAGAHYWTDMVTSIRPVTPGPRGEVNDFWLYMGKNGSQYAAEIRCKNFNPSAEPYGQPLDAPTYEELIGMGLADVSKQSGTPVPPDPTPTDGITEDEARVIAREEIANSQGVITVKMEPGTTR